MTAFLIALVVALVFSSIGFKKYVWFISIGYGFSVAAIGIYLIIAEWSRLDVGTALACALFVAYGFRLGGYLAFRDFKVRSYNANMEGEIKSGDGMPFAAKLGIWVFAALLYACETSPVIFRLENGLGSDALFVAGMAISALGLVVETVADLQKNAAKKRNANRFVSTGLFRIVRCPNYFGELLFWTGVFIGGLTALQGVLQWIIALVGYLGIVYVMFSGARRLEIRQNKRYGTDQEYVEYARTVPIMIPLVPLYSIEKHTWLVG